MTATTAAAATVEATTGIATATTAATAATATTAATAASVAAAANGSKNLTNFFFSSFLPPPASRWGRRRRYETLGLAPTGGICDLRASCLVTEFAARPEEGGRVPYPTTGFGAAYVLAHETGHTLGMRHDGQGGCKLSLSLFVHVVAVVAVAHHVAAATVAGVALVVVVVVVLHDAPP